MPLSDAFSGWNLPVFGVRAPVGGDAPLDPDDGARTRGALDHLGYRRKAAGDDPAALLDDLRDFQTDNGLDVDGLMNPGGPTEAALGVALARVGATDADTPVVPKGDTTERALRSLQETPRYPGDPGLRDHVTRQYEKAYPGPVRRDAAGAMLRPVAAVTPDAIAPYDPKGALRRRQAARHGTAGHRKLDLSDYTDGADAALPPETINAAREATFREAKRRREAFDAWEAREIRPGLTGGDRRAFEAAARRLRTLREQDPEGYGRLSGETRRGFELYEKSREAYEPILRKSLELGLGTEAELRDRYDQEAFEVTMHGGALANAGHAAVEEFRKTLTRLEEPMTPHAPGTLDTAKYDATVTDIESEVPKGFRESPIYGAIATTGDWMHSLLLPFLSVPAAGIELVDAIERAGGDRKAGLFRYFSDTALYRGGKSLLKGAFSSRKDGGLKRRLGRLGETVLDDEMDKKLRDQAVDSSRKDVTP